MNLIQAAINTAIETLARVHGVSRQVIEQAIAAGHPKIMSQMGDLMERMEQAL